MIVETDTKNAERNLRLENNKIKGSKIQKTGDNEKPNFECDLHCHTSRSDGSDTPLELIRNAVSIKMKAVAIVDHDIEPPESIEDENGKKIFIKDYAKKLGLDLVLGCEFSCDSFVDDVHIIGYELNWGDESLKDEIRKAKASKAAAYRKLCAALSLHGMPLDFDLDILHYIDKIGNLHERKPEEVERKHIFEAMALKKYTKTWDEAKLLVRNNPELNIRREKINPLHAISMIKRLGGIAVLAHPYLIDEEVSSRILGDITRDEYIERLIEAGLDGIESIYTYNKTSYRGKLTSQEIKEEVESKFKSKVRFFTGGSDYHNDAKKGLKNPRRIGEAGISYEEFKRIFKNM